MSITVNFYSFSKRDNSTAVPTSASLLNSYDCNLKDGTSMLDPVLLLEYSGIPNWSHFSMEGRFYKVTDIRSVRQSLIEVSGTVDVLASWKPNILATSAFVAYDTSANSEISDHRLSVKTTQSTVVNSDSFSTIGSGVCAVLSITGEGSTSSWAMTVSSARTILDTMDTWMDGTDIAPLPPGGSLDVMEAIDTFVDSFVKICRQLLASGKVADCIKSARICPWPASICGDSGSNIKLGQYGSGKSGYKVDPTLGKITDTCVISIPWQASDWRRNAPYHEFYLYIPYIGVIQLSPSDLVGESQIFVNAHVYLSTGDASITVRTASRQIAQYNTNLSAPFEVGASNTNPAASFTSGAAAIGGTLAAVFTGGATAVAGAIAAGTSAISGVTNNIAGMPSSIGGNAGGAVFAVGNTCYLASIFHDTTVAPSSVSAIIGTPANAVKTLSGLTGYVETRNASVAGGMTDRERTMINRYLDGGVYIE